MNLHELSGPPPAQLAQELAAFEESFTYPLGPGRTFRISHGDDYPRFFRSIGRAVCFVAEREGSVLGCLAVAACPLRLPDGSVREVAYLADLKVAPCARGGVVLLRLARAAHALMGPLGAAFSVVMEGTAVTPPDYTGRLGIPAFTPLARLAVLRVPVVAIGDTREGNSFPATDAEGQACYRRLSAGRYASPGGDPAERSETASVWLMLPDGSACGRLEDTRRAKRLLADDGSELRSAHLACFACRTPEAGAELVHAALPRAARAGFPAVFVAVPEAEADRLRERLGLRDVVVAPATVYGTGLESGPDWNVNTSEI
jgi:hypothetical protein